jgi:nucleolar MIF4G domain-containing protein 1
LLPLLIPNYAPAGLFGCVREAAQAGAQGQAGNWIGRYKIFAAYIGAVSALVLYIEISLATSSQEREIVRVLVDCCLQEKAYNPYYAHLGAKFCHYSYNHKVRKSLVFGA